MSRQLPTYPKHNCSVNSKALDSEAETTANRFMRKGAEEVRWRERGVVAVGGGRSLSKWSVSVAILNSDTPLFLRTFFDRQVQQQVSGIHQHHMDQFPPPPLLIRQVYSRYTSIPKPPSPPLLCTGDLRFLSSHIQRKSPDAREASIKCTLSTNAHSIAAVPRGSPREGNFSNDTL